MKINILMRSLVVAAVTALVFGWSAGGCSAASSEALFPTGLSVAKWQTFKAAGYARPVTGIIFKGDSPRPVCGMPLGGIATGCFDLETSGMIGYSSVFNHLTPRGGPVNLPILGFSVDGRTWVLTTGETKQYDTGRGPISPLGKARIDGVEMAKAIQYWGHYPIADLQFDTGAPVSVALRAWTPFIPGDAKDSNIPGAVFEIHLSNDSQTSQKGTLAFSFPGFEEHKSKLDPSIFNMWAGFTPVRPNLPEHKTVRKPLSGGLSGLVVSDEPWKMSYALGVIGNEKIRTGGALGVDGAKWSAIGRALPGVTPDDGGSSVAMDFSLRPGEKKVVRYVLAWRAPEWRGSGMPDGGGNVYTHMYAKYYPEAASVASRLAKDHESLLKRIIRWQEEIYYTPEIPGWLADSLINNLNTIAKTGVWAQAKPPIGYWCSAEDGVFALNESPRSCSQLDTLPNSACGNLALAYLFPECERSTLRAAKAYQFDDGRPPVVFGGTTDDSGYYELVYPSRGYQSVMNGPNYIARLHRFWKVNADESFKKEFYNSAKLATDWAFNLRPNYGLSQIVAFPTTGTDPLLPYDTEWFEDRPYYGYISHAGGYRMAQAQMMREWALEMGDKGYAKKMEASLKAGAEAMEKYLWTGTYYRVFNEPETGRTHDALFTPHLDGQFFAHTHGVPRVFPKDHVESSLGLIRKACGLSKLGIPPNYVNGDGTLWKTDMEGYLTGNYTYVQFTTYYTAMMFMYEGQKDFGLKLLRDCLDAFSCRWGYTWDGTNVFSGKEDSGERSYGTDYYQNMGLWAAPAAINGQDVTGPCKPGGLIYRIMKAGRALK
ncbi:MAG: hypothetical protein HYX78_03230 [Armatimonadetes bacterium]|nr:hypothetical protein [Armatimonadota bacterium]